MVYLVAVETNVGAPRTVVLNPPVPNAVSSFLINVSIPLSSVETVLVIPFLWVYF